MSGRKEAELKDTRGKATGGKETRKKAIGARETGAKETGGKASGEKAKGAQNSHETGGKGDMFMGVREIDKMLPGDSIRRKSYSDLVT